MWWLIGGGGTLLAVTLAICFVVLILAIVKKRVDSKQEELSKVGWVLEEKLGLEGATPIFTKLGSGNLIGAIKAAKEFARRWFSGTAIDDLIVQIIRKSLTPLVNNFTEHRPTIAKAIARVLPTLLDDRESEKIIEAVLLERITGMKLDAETKAKLAILTGPLNDWGLEKVSTAVMGIATDNADLARMQIHALATELSTEEGRRGAAKRVMRKLVPEFMEVKEDAEYLRSLVAAQPVVA